MPTYSWRILWLIGLPTGMLFILLNRWIPESPRFLLANGRDAEARRRHAPLRRRRRRRSTNAELEVESKVRSRWSQLLSGELLWLTAIVGVLALGSGLVLFGFNLWIPSNLRKLGYTDADAILRNAAIIGFPLNFLVAWMYGFWSSKKTIILLSALTAAALFGFVFAGNAIVQNRSLLYLLLVVPIWGISSVVAVLSVYAAEIYPTRDPLARLGVRRGRQQGGWRGDHRPRRLRHRRSLDRDGRADRRDPDGARRAARRALRRGDATAAARGDHRRGVEAVY